MAIPARELRYFSGYSVTRRVMPATVRQLKCSVFAAIYSRAPFGTRMYWTVFSPVDKALFHTCYVFQKCNKILLSSQMNPYQ